MSLTAVRDLLKSASEHADLAEREVLNYDRAAPLFEDLALDEGTLLRVNAAVTGGLLSPAKSGHYRREPVFVHDPRTGEVVYWPPDHDDVPALMRELFDFVARSNDLGSLVSFEEYYARDVTRYFSFVGAAGSYYDLDVDHTPWLEYFASGILAELRRLEKSLQTGSDQSTRQPPTRLRPHHELILRYLLQHGAITDREYAGLVTRAKSTRALDFNHLIELGLIERRGRGPATYYVLVAATDAT